MIENVINKAQVVHGLKVLKKLNENFYNESAGKKPLFEAESSGPIFLQICLKKVPKTKRIKLINVDLPHSLVKDTSEICLIVGDLDKRNHRAEIEPDILHYKELLRKHGVTRVSQIMTIRQIRTEYKPFEARQKLLAAYDIFLTDNRIAECLPRMLGRHFFKKRKFPIQINMKTKNLKQQIDNALDKKRLYFTGQGDSCCFEVAHLDMDDSEIVENIMAVIEALSENLPGRINNIKAVHLKMPKSKSVPVYASYDCDVQVENDSVQHSVEFDDLTTLPNKMVKVFSDGTVKVVRVKDDKVETMRKRKVNEKGKSDEDKEAQKKNNADFSQSSIDVNDQKDLPELNEFDMLKVEEKKKSKKSKTKKKVEDSDLHDNRTNNVECIKSSEYSGVSEESIIGKKLSKKAKKQKLIEDSNLNNETNMENSSKSKKYVVASEESAQEMKSSKKAKRKELTGNTSLNNDVIHEGNASKYKESTEESTKKKKTLKKSNRKVLAECSSLNSKEIVIENAPDVKEFADVYDESKKEKKSKKAERKIKAELHDFSNKLINENKESPSKINEYIEVQNNELITRKGKLKKGKMMSGPLSDNSNSSETAMHAMKKDMKSKNLGKISKKKLSVNGSFEEACTKIIKSKRKRDESEFSDDDMKNDNRMPLHMKKKAKRENVNRIQSKAMKEAMQDVRKKRECRLRKAKQ